MQKLERPSTGMIILDNFLQDEKAFESIAYSPFWADPGYYWHLMSGLDNGIGSYVVSRMVEEQSIMNAYPFEKALGFEYWPGVFSHDDEGAVDVGIDGDLYHLDVHVDKDENLARATGEFVYPLFGAILYFLEEDIEGGLLKYWVDEHTFKYVEAKNNRLIVFDPSQPHGVTEVTKGLRKALSINFWDHKPHLEEL